MLEQKYATKDLIPAGFLHFYKEVGGEWVLKVATDIKTEDDVARVQEALRKEREDHDATRIKLAAFGTLEPADTLAKIDRIAELELAAKGKLDDAQIDAIVETRITSRLAPVERERDTLRTALDTTKVQVETLQGEITTTNILDQVRSAGIKAKLTEGGLEDALHYARTLFTKSPDGQIVTKEGVGVTPGVDPTVWLTEVQEKKSHWWPAAVGGGSTGNNAGGGGGSNPFSADSWNMTEQSVLVRSNPARAQQMAAAAGTTVGGAKPVAK